MDTGTDKLIRWCGSGTIAIFFASRWCWACANAQARVENTISLLPSVPPPHRYCRPTKRSLPITKLTNFTSEMKVGWFCRLKKICTKNKLFWFSFQKKIINLSLLMNVVLYCKRKQTKTNLQKYYHPSSLTNWHICARALSRKGQQKVPTLRRRQSFAPLGVITLCLPQH